MVGHRLSPSLYKILAEKKLVIAALFLMTMGGWYCSPGTDSAAKGQSPTGTSARPALLLITLDTTRADRLGFNFDGIATPNLDALATGGLVFERAQTTAPMTLPAHASMLTGQYPAGHGVHENARFLDEKPPLAQERLKRLGYPTAAIVSAFPLAREFGLARGFDHYDDQFGNGKNERDARATTDKALELLRQSTSDSLFLWVHYFDPHHPYQPPAPYGEKYAEQPYLGEIAYMDAELGRLLESFRAKFSNHRIIVAGDHGEGLGEHGEAFHGDLTYQSTLHVPLMIAGTGIGPGKVAGTVSTRRVFDTLLSFAGEKSHASLLSEMEEIVMSEAMKPYLEYGWSPQVVAVRGSLKLVRAQTMGVWDLDSDPGEANDISDRVRLTGDLIAALDAYPLPQTQPQSQNLTEEQREKLASLGYSGSIGTDSGIDMAARPDPRNMAFLLADLDQASDLFVHERYSESIALDRATLEKDPANPAVILRLAVAHSVLGQEKPALDFFLRAGKLNPDSIDLKNYLGLHYFRSKQWSLAAEQFQAVLAVQPNRLPARECMAQIEERGDNIDAAIGHYERVAALKPRAGVFGKLGQLNMALKRTQAAIGAFEQAQALAGGAFEHHLELGVCYQAASDYEAAASQLDQVPSSHPGYAMALFKRAQISALRREPDTGERTRAALAAADDQTRALILRDGLLKPFLPAP